MKSLRNNLTASMQKGFTLIELVIVIVIIGILAAVAIPQFSNLTEDATLAKAQGIAGAVNSAYATGLATCSGGLVSCPATPKTKSQFETSYATCALSLGLLEGGTTANGLPTGTVWDVTTPPGCTVKKG